jgi:hypothetical protein
MPLVLMSDASSPPPAAPAGVKVVAGYIGGDTPHVWTAAEWARFGSLRKLPIFTRTNPGAVSAEADAFAALAQLWRVGAPRGVPVAWDLEGGVHVPYMTTVGEVLHWAGFRVWSYGQASTVFGNPALDGYWPASWVTPARPYHYRHAAERATQYSGGPGAAWDFSAVRWWQYRFRLWR